MKNFFNKEVGKKMINTIIYENMFEKLKKYSKNLYF